VPKVNLPIGCQLSSSIGQSARWLSGQFWPSSSSASSSSSFSDLAVFAGGCRWFVGRLIGVRAVRCGVLRSVRLRATVSASLTVPMWAWRQRRPYRFPRFGRGRVVAVHLEPRHGIRKARAMRKSACTRGGR
jgi:hypothetical protein